MCERTNQEVSHQIPYANAVVRREIKNTLITIRMRARNAHYDYDYYPFYRV